jgi:hypothetical protein
MLNLISVAPIGSTMNTPTYKESSNSCHDHPNKRPRKAEKYRNYERGITTKELATELCCFEFTVQGIIEPPERTDSVRPSFNTDSDRILNTQPEEHMKHHMIVSQEPAGDQIAYCIRIIASTVRRNCQEVCWGRIRSKVLEPKEE